MLTRFDIALASCVMAAVANAGNARPARPGQSGAPNRARAAFLQMIDRLRIDGAVVSERAVVVRGEGVIAHESGCSRRVSRM